MSGKMMRATYLGRTYEIPEIWVIGHQQANPGRSIADAIAWWVQWTEIEEEVIEYEQSITVLGTIEYIATRRESPDCERRSDDD